MTQAAYLLDTNYVIDWLKGRQEAITTIEGFQGAISISIITFAEVYEGIYFGNNPTHHEQIFRTFVRFLPVYSITRSIAKRYATLRGDLARKGQLIDQPDLFIAATAIYHDLTLVTRNLKDFDRIPHLKLYQSTS